MSVASIPWLVVQVLLVSYVPGALMMRLPGSTRAARAAIAADERVFWGVLLSVAWSLAAVLALAVLGRYTFEHLLVFNAVCSAAVLAGFRTRLSYGGSARRPAATALVPLAIVALGAWLYFPPSEYVLGGRDPGTYVNEGIQIAQRGSLVIRDPVVAAVPPPFRDLFFPSHQQPWYYGLRFMGFFIQDPDRGDVVGQFPHLFPASVAIGYGLNGLTGARQAVGGWAVLGLLAVYFSGAHVFGRLAATSATLLLAVNVAQVWFARYPNTEVAMQALLFAALLAFARALAGSHRFFGTVAAALLGLMLFLRYDVVLAFASVTAAAVLAPVMRQRAGLTFGIVLALLSALGFWYLRVPMRAYSYYPLGFTGDQVGWGVLAAGLVAALVVQWVLWRPAVATVVKRLLPPALAVVLVSLAVYAYYFRSPGEGLAAGDAMTLRSFAWYTGPWVLGLSVAGMAVAIVRRFWSHPAFFLTFAAFSLFFFYKARIVPEHFWAMRRFLPMTLPGLLLALAWLACWIAGPDRLAHLLRATGRSPENASRSQLIPLVGTACVLALLAPIGYQFWRASEPVRHHVEYAGLIPHIEAAAAQIGDKSLLIVESRNASDLHTLAVPLAYIYARNLLVLASPAPPRRTFEAFLQWAESRYDGVLFLGGGGTDLLTAQIEATPLGAARFQVPEYDAPLNAYPGGVRRKEFEYGLYRLATATDARRGPIDLHIGGADDLNVVRFHARERHHRTGMPFRWTAAQSFVVLNGAPASARSVTLWMSTGGRAASAPEPAVEVAIDGRVLGRIVPTDDLAAYTLPLPPDIVERMASEPDPVRLRLRVATWNPAALSGAPDTRDLGVMVTRVVVQ